MHCDYQLAYCPITYIVALAFRDNAFENERLTSELVWGGLRVPKHLHVLPLRWKKDKLDISVLRRMRQTPSGVEVDPILPMTYDSSNSALKDLRERLGYEASVQYYNFRRWTVNEINRRCHLPPSCLVIHRYRALRFWYADTGHPAQAILPRLNG
jgi:hypothetical protein